VPLTCAAPRPELIGLMALAATLKPVGACPRKRLGEHLLQRGGQVDELETGTTFLFASADPQRCDGRWTSRRWRCGCRPLSVRIFGYHQLSVLVPQALMGVASVALVYDLVRPPLRVYRRLRSRGLALAVTPITVAILPAQTNPDALLVLCCVAALWCTVRGP